MGRKELMEARNANAQLKAEAKQVEDVLINDKTAFPDRAAMVRQQYKDKLGQLDYSTGKATLEEAEAWDKNKFDNEIIAARGYDSPEDYVDLIPNLSVDQKQSRYSLWQHANTYGGKLPPKNLEGAAPATPATPAPATPAPAAPAPTDFKPTEIVLDGKRYRETAPEVWEEVK